MLKNYLNVNFKLHVANFIRYIHALHTLTDLSSTNF